MLSAEDHALFSAARSAQILRNHLIHAFTCRTTDPNELVRGTLVRVLLELPVTAREDYVIGIVTGTEEGVSYNGYSPDLTQYTSLHLILMLSPELARLNGIKFQLNSVSNTGINEAEFVAWKRMMQEQGLELPTVESFSRAAANVRTLKNLFARQGGLRGHQSSRAAAPDPQHRSTPTSTADPLQPLVAEEVHHHHDGGGSHPASAPPTAPVGLRGVPAGLPPVPACRPPSATSSASRAQRSTHSLSPVPTAVNLARHSTTLHPSSLSCDTDAPTAPLYSGGGGKGEGEREGEGGREGSVALQSAAAPMEVPDSKQAELERLVRQDIINQLQSKNALFPKVASDYKLSQLRIAERDMIEYLQHVRDEIANKQVNCVVCLDRVPTVILLPCKHAVLCRLCASTQSRCPICRSAIKEMFEPQEV